MSHLHYIKGQRPLGKPPRPLFSSFLPLPLEFCKLSALSSFSFFLMMAGNGAAPKKSAVDEVALKQARDAAVAASTDEVEESTVKADVAPHGLRAKAKAKEGSGGEGGSTHIPQEESTPRTTQEVLTSQILPLKRSNPPWVGANKACKLTASSSASSVARRSIELETMSLLSEDEEEADCGTAGPEQLA